MNNRYATTLVLISFRDFMNNKYVRTRVFKVLHHLKSDFIWMRDTIVRSIKIIGM